jgi:D-Tyr-tRNAtyr deacylase
MARTSVLPQAKPWRKAEFISAAQVKEMGPRGALPRGLFGADMQVFSQNDGPVTILLDTDQM